MAKLINILIIIAGIVFAGLWLNFFIAREPIPWPIPFLLIAAVAWFFRRFHKPKQSTQAESKEGMPYDINDLFDSFFGFNSKEDCHQWIKLSKPESLYGCIKPLYYKIRKYCKNCNGTGVGVNGSKFQCSECNGAGGFTTRTKVIFGTMNSTTVCKRCDGMGAVIKEPCQHCNGKGFYETQEQQHISIPANFTEHSITIPDKGHYIDEHTRGKLVVTVNHKNKKAK